MIENIFSNFVSTYNYWVYIILMMIGMYAIIIKKNCMKKIIGMSILQTAVILFYISIGAKKNATIPIIEHSHDHSHVAVQATHFINPLPHVLMLTAIVVAVATLGVALALAIIIYNQYDTLEEDELMEILRNSD